MLFKEVERGTKELWAGDVYRTEKKKASRDILHALYTFTRVERQKMERFNPELS